MEVNWNLRAVVPVLVLRFIDVPDQPQNGWHTKSRTGYTKASINATTPTVPDSE